MEANIKDMGEKEIQAIISEVLKDHKPVTRAIENPLTWIFILVSLGAFALSLMYMIYSSDNERKDSIIQNNSVALSENQKNILATGQVVLKLQANQEQISRQIEKNALKIESMSKDIETVKLTRFTEQDGERYYNDIKRTLTESSDAMQRQFAEFTTELKGVKADVADLKYMKNIVEHNTMASKDNEKSLNEISNRLMRLEANSR